MEFINLTPHVVTVYAVADCIEQPGGRGYTLKPDAMVRAVFPPSGTVARATQQQEQLAPKNWQGMFDIPVCRMTYGEPVGLPDFTEGVGLIVSALTANAAKAAGRCTDDLFIVQGIVRDEVGTVVGCTGFSKL